MEHLEQDRPIVLPKLWMLAAVFAAALVILGIGISRAKVAAPVSDPVGGYRSQDEALFANSSMTMATEGHWMTPRFLDRIYLLKPPLQLWLSGLSMKLLGISLFALRLPMLIAGAAGAALVFWWAGGRSAGVGMIAALLLLSDPMWHIFSRLCYTDLLLSFFATAALFFVARDPGLEQQYSIIGFGIATGAAIMTKNVAGAIPILTLFVFAAAVHREQRPPVWRILAACVIAGVVAVPWHVYELLRHFRWFWADYVQTQILTYGVNPPAQISSEIPLVFYAKRLFLVDPVLCAAALAAIPALALAIRRRDPQAVLLSSWVVVIALALSSFQVRGQFRWVLFLIPPLCLMSARFAMLRPKWMIVVLCGAFAVKAAVPAKTWGLSFGEYPPMPAEKILREYSDRARPNPLVAVETDDELYSATLPLSKINYVWIDPSGLVERLAPHYVQLGITVTAAQFDDLEKWEPGFRERLREWGLNTDTPIATAVVATTDADVAKIVATHPDADFYLPARFQAILGDTSATHAEQSLANGRFFLLARHAPANPTLRPKWKLPRNW